MIKKMYILKFTISLLFCLIFSMGYAQKKSKEKNKKETTDSIVYKKPYGIRLGVDISKPILSYFNQDYKGIEFVTDFRITRNWYIAAELGRDNKKVIEDFTTSTSKGNFLKVGANYNTYNNWLDMNNEIYIGGRYGFSRINHTLNSYLINSGGFFNKNVIVNKNLEGTTAHWLEFQLGIKVETFKNLFIGFHGAYKIGLSIQEPKNFKALYVPGFNTVYSSKTGFGFNYTVSYLIPIFHR